MTSDLLATGPIHQHGLDSPCARRLKRWIDLERLSMSKIKNHYHAVIWIDHHEARVFHFGLADVDKLSLHPDHPTRHIHHKANSIGSGHAAEDQGYLHAVAESVADAGEVLITGPANAKTELVKHIHHQILACSQTSSG